MIKNFIKVALACLLTCLSSCKQAQEPYAASTLRISAESSPQTFDPRLARDLTTATAMHALYEGLMRLNENGLPTLAIAEDVSISNDQKTYTFKLKNSGWSNGKAVTAQDFEESWKSVLDPSFPAPNAYQLYVIKGAQAAKEKNGTINDVAVKAVDDKTLVVELDQPTPYFLHLLATHFYYPVSQEMRKNDTKVSPDNLVTNGPFKLEKWILNSELTVEKNPYYWDRDEIELNRIAFFILDNNTALSMFEKGDLDWVGSPLGTLPTDALASLKHQDKLQVSPSAGVYILRFNVDKAPFNEPKLRKAFTLALNRQQLVDHVLKGNQTPALGLIPPAFISHTPHFRDNNISKAQQLFNESIASMHLGKNDLPTINICYAAGERNHKIAQVAQQQWKEAFGVDVTLNSCEGKVHTDNLKKLNYQISIGSWFADYRDPISFLDVFKYKNNGTNNTGWENAQFVHLLNLSSLASTSNLRDKLIMEAEGVLMDDMPVCPLFFNCYNYLKNAKLKDVNFSELGYLDFKNAYFE